MNKYFIIVAFVNMALLSVASGLTFEEAETMLMEVAANCVTEKGASPDDLQTIKNHLVPTTENGKCVLLCMFENFGIIENGAVNFQAFNDAGVMVLGEGNPQVDTLKTMVKGCEGIPITSPCETAAALMQCKVDFVAGSDLKLPF